MEVATNVREFLVGMEDTMSPDKESLLNALQQLHEQYLTLTNDFNQQVSHLALSISPEARVVAHKLRVRIYQDWRVKLMERIFSTPNNNDDDCATCCDGCVCALRQRLDKYNQVIVEFIAASPKIKSDTAANPEQLYESPDDVGMDEEGLLDQLFVFPDFLRPSALA